MDTPNLFSFTVLFLSLFCYNLPSYSELLCSLLSRSCRITYDSPTLFYTNLCYLSLVSLSPSLALASLKYSSLSLSLSLSYLWLWCGGWKWNKVTEKSGKWVFIAYDFYFTPLLCWIHGFLVWMTWWLPWIWLLFGPPHYLLCFCIFFFFSPPLLHPEYAVSHFLSLSSRASYIIPCLIFLLVTLFPCFFFFVWWFHQGMFFEDKTRLGSTPPSCHNKCNECHPCMAVQVPSMPGRASRLDSPSALPMRFFDSSSQGNRYSFYKPLGWKCRCGNHFFNP